MTASDYAKHVASWFGIRTENIALNLRKVNERVVDPVNRLIEEAKQDTSRFAGDAINWGSIQCAYAQLIIDSDGDISVVAIVEEASPNGCPKLCAFIQSEMIGRYNRPITVETQW